MRRPKPTLVDLLARDIAHDPGDGPVVDVQDAVLAQDMAWVEEQLVVADLADDYHADAADHEEQRDGAHDRPPLEDEVPDALGDTLRDLLLVGWRRRDRKAVLVFWASRDDRGQRHGVERDDRSP